MQIGHRTSRACITGSNQTNLFVSVLETWLEILNTPLLLFRCHPLKNMIPRLLFH
jgi:hypothetical protein